jgi:Fic family protein
MSFTPQFTITNAIANDLTSIVSVKGFLEAAILSEDWIRDLQDKALILEAHHTTHIEGTQLTLEQAEKLFQGKQSVQADPDDKRELMNYRDAFDLVADYLGSGDPITEGLVREIHKRLVINVRGNSAAPGEYRKIQNYVVNSKTGETVYTPPPVFELQRMMRDLVNYMNETDEVHPVLVAGIAQFQLVHIHPFLDGNGRTARLLSTLCLYRKGYDFKKLFTISEYYDRNRADYYQAIQSVRNQQMNMTAWLEYFTHALSQQLTEVKGKGEAVIRSHVLASQHQLSARQTQLLQQLLQCRGMTIKEAEQHYPDIPRRTLQRELKGLVDKQLIITEGATNQLIYKLPG